MRTFLLLASLSVLSAFATADEAGEKGRAVFEKYKGAVITVNVVVSVSDGGDARDNQGWANAVVIDPSGLAVVALSFIDPTDIYSKMGDRDGGASVKVASLNMILSEGVELPAEVALRDKELDLAYIRPVKAPESPLASLDLNATAEPRVLDEVVLITQLGKVARRAHSAAVERIEAVIDKPRQYFMLGEHRANAALSAPVFTLDGQFVGFGAMRAITADSDGGFGDNVLVVIVPAKDVKEGAAQVPPAKG